MKILLLLLALSPLAGAAGFSVYLAPDGTAANGAELALREDIHIDVDGQAVPLRLKEARQSIEYPCAAGGRIGFFQMTAEGGRTMLGETAVPATAGKGVIVLAPRGGKLHLTPFWWTAADLRKGIGEFVNLSGRELGLSCAGKKIRLLPGKRWRVEGSFRGETELVPVRVEIFGRRSAEGDFGRILDQSVAVPKKDTGIFLILPKQEHYVTLLTLEASGARDPDALRDLEKRLAAAP